MQRIELDATTLRDMHLARVMTVQAMAALLGCSRDVVYKELARHGIRARTQLEANRLRMSRLDVEARTKITRAANAATRGSHRTAADLNRRAAYKARCCRVSGIEKVFLDAFGVAGLHPVPQYAIGRYNVDFAFPERKLVVEIDPGNWHRHPVTVARDARRDAAFRADGWTVLRWSGARINANNPSLGSVAAGFVASL